ncbi:hypothetical protein DTL70_25765 [Streptomyces diacarni]|uniref:Uncharacterized protein n=1 Tax=Streptomyces diacarni TaxID=2800381 RepID=A0A367EN45_9ACTN|nr:hypothetical protein DTL70_25765 [Streptomyces diacarni]
MWSVGQRARDRKSGKDGEIVQVTLPSPVIYRLRLDDPPGVVVYRYGDQLLPVSSSGGLGRR